jgi:hypothetical protein
MPPPLAFSSRAEKVSAGERGHALHSPVSAQRGWMEETRRAQQLGGSKEGSPQAPAPATYCAKRPSSARRPHRRGAGRQCDSNSRGGLNTAAIAEFLAFGRISLLTRNAQPAPSAFSYLLCVGSEDRDGSLDMPKGLV